MTTKLIALVAMLALAIVGALLRAQTAGSQTGSSEPQASEVRSMPILKRGDRGPAVTQWQERLNSWLQVARTESGRLQADGVFDRKTEAATRDFQKAQEIPVDGIVGPITRSAFLSAPALAEEEPDPAADTPFLRPGDRGPKVAEWQAKLNDWLQINRTEQGRLSIDGVYGPKTATATRDFQRDQGITVDGLAGPETRAALFSAPRSSRPRARASRARSRREASSSLPGTRATATSSPSATAGPRSSAGRTD